MTGEVSLELGTEIIRAARLCAVSCSRSTQPYGNTPASKKIGEAAVMRDICKVYSYPSPLFLAIRSRHPQDAGAFWEAYKKRDQAAMQAAMERAGYGMAIAQRPDPALHQAARTGRRGGVRSRQSSQLLLQPGSREKYIKAVQKNVGFGKGGWARAAEQLGGTRGIPAWAGSKQPGAPGRAIITPHATKPKVVIENDVGYIHEIITPTQISEAVAIAYERLFKQLAYLAKRPRRLAA
jgi:hypothetical protein